MNILIVVRLAPGVSRGRADGIDVWYHLGGHHYYLKLLTALAADTGTCRRFEG